MIGDIGWSERLRIRAFPLGDSCHGERRCRCSSEVILRRRIDFEEILCGMLTDRMRMCKRSELMADAWSAVPLVSRFGRVHSLARLCMSIDVIGGSSLAVNLAKLLEQSK